MIQTQEPVRKSQSTSTIQIEGSLPVREFDNLYEKIRRRRPDVKAYQSAYNKEYRKLHKEKLAEANKVYRSRPEVKERVLSLHRKGNRSLRLEVLLHYSQGYLCCCRCGFDDPRALQLDHIDNNGSDHRRSISGRRDYAGVKTYSWLRRNNYPEGYQVLCANCNWIKEREYRDGQSIPAK